MTFNLFQCIHQNTIDYSLEFVNTIERACFPPYTLMRPFNKLTLDALKNSRKKKDAEKERLKKETERLRNIILIFCRGD